MSDASDAHHQVRRGIAATNLSMMALVVGDSVIKSLGQSFSPHETIFIRSIVIVLALGLVIWTKGYRLRLDRALSWPMVMRCIFDSANILLFTITVVHMRIGELYALLLTAPLMMTAFAALFQKERVGPRRWLAIIVGFCGTLLIIKPDFSALDHWALLGLLAAFTAAMRETISPRIDPEASTIEVLFYAAIFVGVAALLFGGASAWQMPTQSQMLLIALHALMWFIGASLLFKACRLAPLFFVASFRYTMLPWGGLAGYFVFGEIPDLYSFLGAGLIALSGLYVFYREAVLHRARATSGAADTAII